MLYVIGVALLAIWLIGLAMKVTFAAFHLLVLLAVIALVWGFLRSRTSSRSTV